MSKIGLEESKPVTVKTGRRKRLAWGVIGGLLLAAVVLWAQPASSLWNLWRFSTEFSPLPTSTPAPQAKPAPPDAGLGLDFSRLGNFGLSTGLFSFRLNRPTTQAEAQKDANFAVRLPTYNPPGFGRSEGLNLLKRAGFKFTLDLSRARPYLKELGIEVDLPDDLNGKTIIVTVGDVIFTVYQRPSAPGLSTAQTRYLFSSGLSGDLQLPPGISLDDFRQGAARVPVSKVPPILYSQWGVVDPAGANPLPVPPGMTIREVTVDGGAKGKIYRTNAGSNSNSNEDTTIAWQKEGIFYFINGGLSDEELLNIANSLR